VTSDASELDAEIVVIGAGIVGLAIAQRLASDGRSVVVIERREGLARETSSHNSGVVHASIYYPTGSLKHRLCWEGNARIYAWCDEHSVPVRHTGKIIVALAEEERAGLDDVYEQAVANNVRGVERIGAERVREGLDELSARGLIHERADAHPALTAAGCAVLGRLVEARRAHLAELAEEWDPARREDVAAYLRDAVREVVPNASTTPA
jgi:L-2-hydroxyglutarate oxidase LhgO